MAVHARQDKHLIAHQTIIAPIIEVKLWWFSGLFVPSVSFFCHSFKAKVINHYVA